MNHAATRMLPQTDDAVPSELMDLLDRIKTQPYEVRAQLEPILDEVVEHARFRGRILTVAREALERLRLERDMALFDLDATRRERESLRQLLDDER